MLTTTINSYLYKQYQNDDDLQAFVTSYNLATQTYVDWFNQTPLAYYPGLFGPLLDWVAEGLYGISRPTFEQTTAAIGPINSETMSSNVLNYFTPPVMTYFTVNDDFFQRLMTWNLFKGDGKRFCMRWLKRRIMRFLLGANGIDPQPTASNFVVGVENTTPVSVQVLNSGTALLLTVTISQSQLSSIAHISPGVLNILKLAFTSGVLELPAQYVYSFVIGP